MTADRTGPVASCDAAPMASCDAVRALVVAVAPPAIARVAATAPDWCFLPAASVSAVAEGAPLDLAGLGDHVVPVQRAVHLRRCRAVGRPAVGIEQGNRWLRVRVDVQGHEVEWDVALVRMAGPSVDRHNGDERDGDDRGSPELARPAPVVHAAREGIELGAFGHRLVTELCGLIGDTNPIHTDQAAAHHAGFDDLAVPGSLAGSVLLAASARPLRRGESVTLRFKRWVLASEPVWADTRGQGSWRLERADGRPLVSARWPRAGGEP